MKASALSHRPSRSRALFFGGLGLVLALGAAAASPAYAVARTYAAAHARAAASGGTWGRAKPIPGLAALNVNGDARVNSVSCAQPGDCAAGGAYTDGPGHAQAFVASEANGVWGRAENVPGLAALNVGEGAGVFSVSCAQPGDCSAGGFYTDSSGFDSGIQAFVVSEKNGVWGQAKEVPGLAALNTTGHAEVTSVSCARPGDCGAVGHYRDSMFAQQGFVVSQANGVWGQAQAVPGLAALNQRSLASVNSVSCAAAGECSAGGFFEGGAGVQGFVVGETNGVWGQAKRVPGLGALNIGGNADVTSVSCARPGDCGAGGSYAQTGPDTQGFVVSEKNGVWGRAEEIPGLSALRTGRFARVLSLSCASPGDCAAGGFYEQASFLVQGFVVNDTGGVWRRAQKVPGLAALNSRGDAVIGSVSCTAPGECSAGGSYRDASGAQGFVVRQT
jgi:hypothetical protein